MFVFTNVTYRWPGGADNLVYLLVEHLFRETGEKVMIFGKEDSYLVGRLLQNGIGFEFYDIDDDAGYAKVGKNDVLVLSSSYYGLKKFRRTGCRVLVWNILTFSMIRWNRLQFLGENRLAERVRFFFNRGFLRFLRARNALVCMDATTRRELDEYMGASLETPIIQVPIKVSENRHGSARPGEVVNITYIGRGDEEWKVAPVKKIVGDLRTFDLSARIHVFTSQTDLFERELAGCAGEGVGISYHTGYYGERLQRMLLETSDVNFSMGMSALESASIGVPTILIDPTHSGYPPGYRYRWLFEARDFSLGEFVDEHSPISGSMDLRQVIGTLRDDDARRSVSERSFDHVRRNHAVGIVFERFMNHRHYVSIRDVARFTPNMWL